MQSWYSLAIPDRLSIRDCLWTIYYKFCKDSSKIHRNKIAQLIGLIGKREFPQLHPAYMDQVKSLFEHGNTFVLGLVLLRATCEEILSTKADISVDRKKIFTSAVGTYLPSFVPLLNQSVVQIGSQLHHFKQEGLRKDSSAVAQFVQQSSEVFTCIQTIFQCDLIDDGASFPLVQSLFMLARSNCDPSVTVWTLETVHEVLARQRIYKAKEVIAKGLVELLRADAGGNQNEPYSQCLLQLLQTASKQCTVRWWNEQKALESYLDCLWTYTINTEDAITFSEKLTLWTPIFRHYVENGNEVLPDSMLTIGKLIMDRVFLHLNEPFIQVIFEVTKDVEADWNIYVDRCQAILVLIAQSSPVKAFELIFTEVTKAHGPLDIVTNVNNKAHNVFLAMINDVQTLPYLRMMLRDLATTSQILARTLPLIQLNLGDSDSPNYTRLEEVVTKLVEIAHSLLVHISELTPSIAPNTATSIGIFNGITSLGSSGGGINTDVTPLYTDLVETAAQLFTSISYLIPISSVITNNQVAISSLYDNAAQFLMKMSQVPLNDALEMLTTAIASFLKDIIIRLRVKYLMDGKSIHALMRTDFSRLNNDAFTVIQMLIFNCLVLAWRNESNQEQQRRIALTNDYVQFFGSAILAIDSNLGQQISAPVAIEKILQTITVFQKILDTFRDESSFSKQILVQSFKPITEKVFCIFKSSFQNLSNDLTGLKTVLNYFNSLIMTLHMQLNVAVIKELVLIFIENCKREQLSTNRLLILDYLLKIFLNVLRQHTQSSTTLLPDILKVVIGEVAPLLFVSYSTGSVECFDVILSLYAVFDVVLQERWQYFFKSQVMRGFSPGASDDLTIQTYEEPSHPEHFQFILNAYIQGLSVHSNLELTRMILTSLQAIDEKHKLFGTLYFQRHFLNSFQYALIQCLGAAEGIINFDLCVAVLYRVSITDMSLLENIFHELCKSLRGEQKCFTMAKVRKHR